MTDQKLISPSLRFRTTATHSATRAISEIRGVSISLGATPLSACDAFDRDADGQVMVDELVLAVRAALAGC